MSVELLPLTDRTATEKAIAVLTTGGIVALPTDTVYGLCVRADLATAVEKLRALKRRATTQPFQVLFSDLTQLKQFAIISKATEKILQQYFPGALTAVLPLRSLNHDRRAKKQPLKIAEKVSTPATIGARIPDHPWLRQKVLTVFPAGLVATSANRAGETPLSDPAMISREFGEEIDLIIDAGKIPGVNSTVAVFEENAIKILRQGAVKLSMTN